MGGHGGVPDRIAHGWLYSTRANKLSLAALLADGALLLAQARLHCDRHVSPGYGERFTALDHYQVLALA